MWENKAWCVRNTGIDTDIDEKHIYKDLCFQHNGRLDTWKGPPIVDYFLNKGNIYILFKKFTVFKKIPGFFKDKNGNKNKS